MKKIWLIPVICLAIVIVLGLLDRMAFVTGVAGAIFGGVLSFMIFRKKDPSPVGSIGKVDA